MYQIKIITSQGHEALESKVNAFLRERAEKLRLVDIKYNVFKETRILIDRSES
jgi:hypothetical protein